MFIQPTNFLSLISFNVQFSNYLSNTQENCSCHECSSTKSNKLAFSQTTHGISPKFSTKIISKILYEIK